MRDFRNAKVMAQTLRAALVAKGLKITVSRSLELAAMFGVADWNTLAATIRGEKPVAHEKVSTTAGRGKQFGAAVFGHACSDAASGPCVRHPAKA
jgi:hypothetical protein